MIRQILIHIWVIVLTAGMIFCACDKSEPEPEEISFTYDITEALKLAVEKEQPVVAEFFRPDCPWSRMMDDSTFTNKLVISMSLDMVFAKINAFVDTAAARKYGVSFYPTFIVFNSSGEEIDRLVGYYPPADFFNEVQLYLQGNETLQDYHIRLADEPERADYSLVLAEKYKHRSNWEKALEYYNNVLKLADEDSQYEIEQAMHGIADIYCEQGMYEEAALKYEEFLTRYPESEKAEDAARKLPYCLAQDGQIDKAREYFQNYLDSYQDGIYTDWVKNKIEELDSFIKAGR